MQIQQEKKIVSLYFKLEGPDLFVYKTEALTKVAFIITLPVCEFSLLELDSFDDSCIDSQKLNLIQ